MSDPDQGTIDLTVMYAAHDAFRRDLDRLAGAVAAGKAGAAPVRRGWENFEHQLRVHDTAEDAALWPRVRDAVRGSPADLALLDELEAEHARMDPLLDAVGRALADGTAGIAEHVHRLRRSLDGHLRQEESSALPLVQSVLGPADWQEFLDELRRRQGLKGAAVFVPWIIDGVLPTERSRFLSTMPPRVRALTRLTWEPGYRKLRLWTA
jgi:iron-sulfur cluster repair protein YtfE (RIC family)